MVGKMKVVDGFTSKTNLNVVEKGIRLAAVAETMATSVIGGVVEAVASADEVDEVVN